MEIDESCNKSDHKADCPMEDDEIVPMDVSSSSNSKMGYRDLNRETLERFCKDAARAFFTDLGLISHQINSFNEFITNGIQELFNSLGEVVVEPGYDASKGGGAEWRHATITYGKVRLEKPSFWTDLDKEECVKLLPRHARLQNMSYSSKLKVEVRVQVYILEKSDKAKTGKSGKSGKAGITGMDPYISKRVLSDTKKEIVMGSLPVMVKSRLCWLDTDKSDCLYDSGGYFIVNGAEKRFIAQEQRCFSRLWINDKPCWSVQYMSEIKNKRVYLKLLDATKESALSGGKIISLYFMYVTIPVWIMFFALGASSDKEVFQMIDLDDCDRNLTNVILATIKDADEECEGFRNVEKAKDYVDSLIKTAKFPVTESFDEYISKYLFPAIMDNHQKALFLGYMVKCLLLSFIGKRKVDNKDDFRNKRLDLVGDLLRKELWCHVKHAERKMVRAMQRDLYGDRDLQLIERYFDASVITMGLNRAFATGQWCHPYKKTERISGVVATLRRANPLQMISDLRKTRQQVVYAGKAGDARYPNPSYWGKLCFLSTPDGENCGFVKNLAVTTVISSKLTEHFLDKLVSCGMSMLDQISITFMSKMDKVLLNGDWIGVCLESSTFVVRFRQMRRTRQINPQVEIKWDKRQHEVRIFSDSGRLLRPLLVVENLHKIKYLKGGVSSFQSLLDEGLIELIGVEEEEDCQTACGIKYLFEPNNGESTYTHSELDPSFVMGLSCGLIPFANHNFARRVLYQAEKHSQQAIGYSTTNPDIRVDTLIHQLYYPQRPLFKTVIADCLGRTDYSLGLKNGMSRPEFYNGQNAIVAVNVHQGYNQEDSLVMNKASLERGMFRTELLRSYKAEVDNKEMTRRIKQKDKVDFGKMQSKRGRVDSLEDDGFPYVGASLQSGDIVIGKVSNSGEDHGVKLKHTEKGMVHKVVVSANDDGKNFAAVILRQVRSPCLGDKFSSMHGQKGVVGHLESQENFSFTSSGIVPDIVINPQAFPTRQTVGQLLEAALGKGIALGGEATYATPFTTPSAEVIAEQLHRLNFQQWGSEKVICGHTGQLVQSLIFMGPTFYQRLIHMSEDKLKFRNTGPVHPLTRQPVADRKRFGGVKFGEMERDCLLAHGATANLHERLFTLSDFSQMHVCRTCEHPANVIQRGVSNGKIRGAYCSFCKSAENIIRVNVPYGAKLLFQELFSVGICLKFETEVR